MVRLALLPLAAAAALFALDRVLVGSTGVWTWLARELPRRMDDPCLVEAMLRSLPKGRANVLVLGNSRADEILDLDRLEQRFARPQLRFHNLTVAGSGVVEYAMLSAPLAALEPRAALLMIHASALRDVGWADDTFAYDSAVALRIFTPAEFVASTGFQLDGLAGQLHVLARHRSALQGAALVWLGRTTFREIQLERRRRIGADQRREGRAYAAWLAEAPGDPDNPNTRALGVLAQRLGAAGVRLIVLEAPSNPLTAPPEVAPRLAAFRTYLTARAAREGFSFVPVTRMPPLDDFKDRVHASPAGRARYTERIAAALAPELGP